MLALVTGTSGQLGHDLAQCLIAKGYDVIGPSRAEMDFTYSDSVSHYINTHRPDVVYHCGAWTAVDLAESETDACRKTNVDGTKYITEACRGLEIPLVYISTDYVFDGSGSAPWEVDAVTAPINEYGRSKRDAERIVLEYPKHYIVRISWVFGINGKNFVKTMLNLSEKTNTVRVVCDQFGALTYTYDLSPLLVKIAESGRFGTYHAHNEGFCSWYDVAVKIFEIAGKNMTVIPIPSSDYPLPARRPHNSRLSTKSLTDGGFDILPRWEDALKRFLKQIL